MNDNLNLPSRSDIGRILELDKKKLPSFPQVAVKLLEASKDETASLGDLSKIIETDPGISAKVLEIVNSAMYGLGRKITTLSEAVVFLGLDEVKKLAIGMTVFEKMFKNGHGQLFDRLLFWRHCLAVAVLSQQIAKTMSYPNPEEAYIAGLLHDIGKIFLDISGKTNYGDFIKELSESTEIVIEKEREFIGLGHDDIGAFFCAQWKLPDKLTAAVKFHHQSFESADISDGDKLLTAAVSLADFLCWTQGMGSFDFIRPPILSPEVEKTIPIEEIDILGCIQQTNEEIEKISQFYQFIFPSAAQLKENMLWANLKLSRATTRYYYQEDPLKQVRSETTGTDMLEVGKLLAKAKTIKEVLDIVMYQVGKLFQPVHWSILLEDPKTKEMVFSCVVGTNKEKLMGVKLPRGEGVAGHIMKTQKALIIEDVSKDDRFSIRMDDITGFKTQSIIGTPLKTDRKCFGVIELVNRISEDLFSQDDLELLSAISEYAAIAIERAYYNQALTNLATKDALTGLKNRWSFERAVSNKEEILKQYGTVFSILIVTVKLNASNSGAEKSPGGTEDVIKKLSQVLLNTKRRKDTPFRYAENIFILLLPLTYSDGAQMAKQRMSKAFNRLFPDSSTSQEVKIDISTYTINAEDAGHLKSIIKNLLSTSDEPAVEDTIHSFEETVQPIIEEENIKEAATLKKTGAFGKSVSLAGEFVRLKTGESGHIRVEQLSLVAIGFRISRSHRIQVNDFLDIQFVLDDINRSLVKRRAVVRQIKGNYIDAEFYNPPPYAKTLGFYLLS